MDAQKPSNYGAKWTPEQDTWLVQAIAKDIAFSIIANKMGRTKGSIISRLKLLAYNTIQKGSSIEDAMVMTKLSRESIEEFSIKHTALKNAALAKKLAAPAPTPRALVDVSTKEHYTTQHATYDQLNTEQKDAIDHLKVGHNILITGSAGCGKSFLVKYIIIHARTNEKNIGICAMTGSASVLIGGTTLHSFMGIGLANDSVEYLVRKIRGNINNKVDALQQLHILLIDEVSMMNDELLTKMSQILSIIRKNPEPFGGVQIILVGDPFQLAPITYNYFFKSPEWTRGAFKVVLLKANMRQSEDSVFKDILDRVRWGNCNKSDYKLLKQLRHTVFPVNVIPTRLYSHNKDVIEINNTELQRLIHNGTPIVEYTIKYKGSTEKKNASKSYAKATKLEESLQLCKGAQVILTRNIDVQRGLVNGARGVVIECMESYVNVGFTYAGIVQIDYFTINSYNMGTQNIVDIDVSYIPLKHAWALSIHASQGMTIDALELDLGSSIFAYGQAYTGLSRAQNMKSIKLVGLLPESFKTSPDVVEFYSTLV